MISINQKNNNLIDHQAYSYIYVEAALAEYNKASSNLRGFILFGNPQDEAIYYQAISKGDFHLNKAQKLLTTDQDQKSFAWFKQLTESFKKYSNEIIALVKARNSAMGEEREKLDAQLNELFAGNQSLIYDLANAGESFAKIQSDQLEQGKGDNLAQVKRNLAIAVVIIALTLLILAGVSVRLFKTLKEFSQQLAEKSRLVETLTLELNDHCERVAQGANETATTANEVAAAMEEANANTQSISQQVEKLSASMNQIAHSSGQAAMFSREGEQGLQAILNQMENIRQAVQTNENMVKTLGEDASKINQIISIINQVAEQTNLLALNAAIEAARAGEHGRGFAVVAEEVRKLAEQSANSTKDIYQLIANINNKTQAAMQSMGHSVAEVQNSTQVVENVSTSFTQILTAVDELSGEIQSAAAASDEMSSALQQVMATVENVSNTVQNVAASAEEQTASSEEIASSTVNLTSLVSQLDEIAKKM